MFAGLCLSVSHSLGLGEYDTYLCYRWTLPWHALNLREFWWCALSSGHESPGIENLIALLFDKSHNLIGTLEIAKFGPKQGQIFQRNVMSLC